jgi:hypothetical protein
MVMQDYVHRPSAKYSVYKPLSSFLVFFLHHAVKYLLHQNTQVSSVHRVPKCRTKRPMSWSAGWRSWLYCSKRGVVTLHVRRGGGCSKRDGWVYSVGLEGVCERLEVVWRVYKPLLFSSSSFLITCFGNALLKTETHSGLRDVRSHEWEDRGWMAGWKRYSSSSHFGEAGSCRHWVYELHISPAVSLSFLITPIRESVGFSKNCSTFPTCAFREIILKFSYYY